MVDASTSPPEQAHCGVSGLLNAFHIAQVTAVQRDIASQLTSSRRALARFDRQSSARIGDVAQEIEQNCVLLAGIAADLKHILIRSRQLKTRLQKHYGVEEPAVSPGSFDE
ncbi:hypothetical protein WJX73_005880 [Symbiochloris irregularis]|uniref:KxDL domain-containing protein n=1 Tax=Symbiochloris irregularis TaxID=706552 RepID=A0AAW1NPM8_9CHLO